MIEHLWSTPVLRENAPFSTEQIAELAKYAKSESNLFKESPIPHSIADVNVSNRYQFNLLKAPHASRAPEPVWSLLKKYVDKTYRDFIRDVHGVGNADEIRYVARFLPVHYETINRRTMPHYHHTCDHVMCIYLETGNKRVPASERDPKYGDGELILCDPRPMGSFPFWEKTKIIDPYPGLCVMHPSRVWHETNPFTSQGDRTLLAITLRIESHNYTDLYEPLNVL